MSKILFKSVLVVILFHALIPHPHSDELSEKEHLVIHQQKSSFFGILKVVLHEGVDESLDHLFLSESSSTKEVEKNFSKHVTVHSVRQKLQESCAPIFLYNFEVHNYSKFFIVNLNGKRGPPWVS